MKSTLKKSKLFFGASGLAAAIVAGCITEHESESQLAGQARISRAQAEQAALAKAPGGVIKEGELEKEHGKLIYSFDVAMAGSKDITEIHVDALTGEVIQVEKESAAEEAREKHSGRREKDDDNK